MIINPTLLGFVRDVSGSTVRVQQTESVASGMAIINGRTYRIGQVGSFVRIPQGYQDLFGIVTTVGASAAPLTNQPIDSQSARWLLVQLVGESIGSYFERGISQHPTINDEVHLVTENDLVKIYGSDDPSQVMVGHLASAESIEIKLDIDKIVTRHAAILGSTGSGKSTTVSSILRSISTMRNIQDNIQFPNARILLLDIHGEYVKALGDIAKVFRINANQGENELFIPYWALDFDDLVSFLSGGISEEKAMHFRDKILELKTFSLTKKSLPGADPSSLTVDTPVPFSLKQLWYKLIDEEVKTFEGPDRDQPALLSPGDPDTLSPPRYKPWTQSRSVVLNQYAPGIRRQLDHLRSLLFDHRYDFLLHPGDWEPNLNGLPVADLDSLFSSWLGHDQSITIIDLSGIPSTILTRLIGSLLRIIYDALFWSRDKSMGGVERPLLIVMEEAHSYLGKDDQGPASKQVRRIVKEGRKYGIGALIISQRPSEVDETILSQCGTFITLRLSNPNDRNQVQGTLPDHLAGLMDMLPILRTGEAIITGEASRLPSRVRISLPPENQRPESEDPDVNKRWQIERLLEDYEQVLAALRSQSPRAVKEPISIKLEPVEDDSSWRED